MTTITLLLGVRVFCDRPLPGAPVADDAADVVVERLDLRPERPTRWAVGDDWPLIATSGDHVSLWYDDDVVFDFDRGGRSIRYALLNPDLDDETFAHELIDSVMPRLLATHGHHVLHGGSVAGPAGAVVVVGDSGAGKSTLSAALATAGYQLVGDDVAVISNIEGVDHVAPSGTSLRLYEHSAVAAMTEPVLGPAMAHWSVKRLVEPVGNGLTIAASPVPVRAVVRLELGAGPPTLVRLDPGIGFEMLARNCFDLPYESPMGGLELLERWAPLSERLPTYALRRRFDLDELPAVCTLLRPLLDGDG